MPDEPNVAPVEPDQPQVEPSAPAAPPETGQGAEPQPSHFDEKFDPASLPDELRPAYNQMRADYTQKTQSLADQRREADNYQQLVAALVDEDPQVRAQALSVLGYDFEQPNQEPQDESQFIDPTEERLNQHEAYIQQQAQAQQEAELGQFVNEHLDNQWQQLEQQTGRTFSDGEHGEKHYIERIAATVPDENGLPDLQQAYELYSQHLGEARQNWIESKKAPAIPVGRQGEPKIDLNNEEQRVRFMAQVAEANSE